MGQTVGGVTLAKLFPEALYLGGYTDLIPVIPPGAQLSPASKIPANMVGKIPGRRNANGTWGGFNWRAHSTTLADVIQWATKDNASFGLRSDRFPGVDVDCTDPGLSKLIADYVVRTLGPAPVRIGRAPKQLLMYRTDEAFGRMRLWIKTASAEHLVEILGVGQQYLVHGLHPVTELPYRWLSDVPPAAALTCVTREQCDRLLTDLAATIERLDLGFCTREADGRAVERGAVDQDGLLAPSLDALAEAVRLIPNDDRVFNTRTDYLRMGYAIKAAAGDGADVEAFEIFAEWASRWDGGVNEPDVVLADWRRMNGTKSVGWNWIAEQARGYGYNDAANDFDVLDAPDARRSEVIVAPLYSDQWLAEEVIRLYGARIRYVPERGCFLVWADGRWKVDAELLAEDLINQALRTVADTILRQCSTDVEAAKALREARAICSASKAASVATLLRSHRSIAVGMATMDHDPMQLNTPGGIVDLFTGTLHPADPAALCTKATTVAPDFSGNCPRWLRFLDEVTRSDQALIDYLQRMAGYCLTGRTSEQHVTFIWGDGKNGKSVFLNVLEGVLGDYAKRAPMDTFTASNSDKHTTNIAGLHGARLVSASETAAGKRWDEPLLKNLSGGEPVTARFMRQDNFTYLPQFKLVFIGNHKPELRSVGEDMRRRLHLVPFTFKPAVVDRQLPETLRAEYPAILGWMIAGCLAWQQEGLSAPPIVKAATDDYFQGEDAIGDWMKDCVEQAPDAHATTEELFQSWREWSNRNNEYTGSKKRLASTLIGRGIPRWQDTQTRKMGFDGIRLVKRDALLEI